jgi:DNA-binding CsgD family transcriptional regulator
MTVTTGPGLTTRGSRVVDGALVCLLLGLALLTCAGADLDTGIQFEADETRTGAALVPLVVAQTLPLLARRRWPGAVLLAVAAALALRSSLGLAPTAADFGLLIAVYSAGAHARGVQWWGVVGCAAAPLLGLLNPQERAGPGDVIFFYAVFLVGPLVTGLVGRGASRSPKHLPGQGPAPRTPRPAPTSALSTREIEVIRLVAIGLPNHEVASALFVSPETVKTHVSRILTKLGVRNRTEAALRARDLGLLPDGAKPARPTARAKV